MLSNKLCFGSTLANCAWISSAVNIYSPTSTGFPLASLIYSFNLSPSWAPSGKDTVIVGVWSIVVSPSLIIVLSSSCTVKCVGASLGVTASTSTVAVTGFETFPASSLAVALSVVSPSPKGWESSTSYLPSGSTVTLLVFSSPFSSKYVIVINEPASPVPLTVGVVSSVSSNVLIVGSIGAVKSITTLPLTGLDSLPFSSIVTTDSSTSPSANSSVISIS